MKSQALKLTRVDNVHIEGLTVLEESNRWTAPAGGWLEGRGVWSAGIFAGTQGTMFKSENGGENVFFLVGYSPFMILGTTGRAHYFTPTDGGEWRVITEAGA